MKFCSACGSPVEVRIPDDGDHLPRHVCTVCKTIHYINPKIIVGVIPEASDGRVLMCRRNIEPRKGMWTFPAGFMELGETSAQGAAREGLEESLAVITVQELLCVISVTYVSQVYMIHRGLLPDGATYGATTESSEVVLMREDEIPWNEIAFPTIYQSLKYFFADRTAGLRGFHSLDLTHKPSREKQAEITSWLAAALG
jgi:ADP-ribose pyrophosphatase YjhB (NUDIX family)